MSTRFQNEDDILQSINLTTKLQSSLNKLLTNKKKQACKHQCLERHREHQQILDEVQSLRAEKEVLIGDNQLLSKELLNCKQQLRQVSKEVKELKKYVNFLQGYNSTLKKQMAYWVKKPRNQQVVTDNPTNYERLNQEIDHLKKMNDLREKELWKLDNTVVVKPGPSDSKKNLFYAKSTSTSKKMTKHSITLTKNDDNQCNKCSSTKMTKNSMAKNKSFSGKRTKLCSCHKSYIQTSDFVY